MKINLGITSREGTRAHREGDYTHLLSLLDPERGYDGVSAPVKIKTMSLITFHDLDDIEIRAPEYLHCIPPNEEHIRDIFKMFEHLEKSEGDGILVHCEAGVSRSTAASILGLCHLGLPPRDAFGAVVNINEMGLANRRMLRVGGKMLGDNGELLEIAEAHRKHMFVKYGQLDPIELLRVELQSTGYWSLRWRCLLWLLRNVGRSQSAGSDLKMISRLRMRLGMGEKLVGKRVMPTVEEQRFEERPTEPKKPRRKAAARKKPATEN